ncbi:MAG: RsmE family RNA methyltransferase [Kiritimatiellae bacterium]|nr:RsmE family RNA methyltransferase [Kiritimatiellia bacterium]
MNRILLAAAEVDSSGRAVLHGRRARHIREVLRAQVGERLRAGMLDGPIGSARVEEVTADSVRVTLELNAVAPEPWIDLLLALPRPKALKRLWPQLAALGVGRIVLINAARVERCYFDTHWIAPEHYEPLLLEGLEQAGTTHRPEVWLRRGFKPFVEDELEAHYGAAAKLLAQPGPTLPALPLPDAPRPLLAVGPEGGWTDYEQAQLAARGFKPFSLGPRTLRTDTACIALLGCLMSNQYGGKIEQ